LLLFLVGVGSNRVFPVILGRVRTDMPPTGTAGAFLFVLLVVLRRQLSIERFLFVTLAVLLIGIAVFAVVCGGARSSPLFIATLMPLQ